jgi:RimJ/RimL family protein N-acetyltransferase
LIGGKPPSADDLRTRFERWSAGHSADGAEEWRNWLVRVTATGEAVGTMQATIVEEGTAAWIAWLIGVRWQGRGFATEAGAALVAWLTHRGVTNIRADIHPDHTASAAVARRLGLAETTAMVDGERVWELRQLETDGDPRPATDESR